MSIPVKAHPNALASSRTLVVGGTSGLGAAVVSGALANGGSVHVSSSNADKIASKLTEFKSLYPNATVSGTAADFSDEKTIEENVERVLKEAVKSLGGPLDHIVYTAGDQLSFKSVAEIDAKTYFRPWNVRYLGPLIFSKFVAANPGVYLKNEASSSVTLTSGLLSRRPSPGVSAFIPAAGAIETLSRALAVDLAPVRVNVVIPGAVRTELLAEFPAERLKVFEEKSLVKAVGAPSQVAEAYLFSMRSAFATGQEFIVDGGAFYM